MKRFYYRVVTLDGQHHEGHLLAVQKSEAKSQILNTFSSQAFLVVLKPAPSYRHWVKHVSGKKIDLIRKLHFTRQLQSLLSSGVTLVEALSIIRDMSRDREMRSLVTKMIHDLGTGLGFSQTCERVSLYTDEEIALIRAGEVSGVLAEILLDLYHIMEWDKLLLDKVKKALRYPAIVLGVTFMAMMGVFTFVIPKFSSFFVSNQMALPMLTRVMLGISGGLMAYGGWILLGLVATVFLLVMGYQKPVIRARLDTYVFYLPVVGPLYKHLLIARFSRIFSILYTHGISILEALQILKQLSMNTVYQRDIAHSIASVRQGISLSASTSGSLLFSGTPSQMMYTGEKAGTLGGLMKQASDFYSEDITFVTDRLFTYLEPFTILLIGTMVLCLSLGVFMPMIGLITSVGK